MVLLATAILEGLGQQWIFPVEDLLLLIRRGCFSVIMLIRCRDPVNAPRPADLVQRMGSRLQSNGEKAIGLKASRTIASSLSQTGKAISDSQGSEWH